jgi:hypothetical protein
MRDLDAQLVSEWLPYEIALLHPKFFLQNCSDIVTGYIQKVFCS